MMKEYFTIEEVAELPGFTLERVQKEIKKDELVCAWRIHNPLEGKDGITGVDCSIPAGVYLIGVFPYSEDIKMEEIVAGEETGNYYNTRQSFRCLKWGRDKIARVNQLSVCGLCEQTVLIQDEWASYFHNIEHTLAKHVLDWGVVAEYILREPITVPMENVLIPKWSLKKYLEKSGRDLDIEIPIGKEESKVVTEEERAMTPAEKKSAEIKKEATIHLRNNPKVQLGKLIDDLDGLFGIKGQAAYGLLVQTGNIKDRNNLIARREAAIGIEEKKAAGNAIRQELLKLKIKNI